MPLGRPRAAFLVSTLISCLLATSCKSQSTPPPASQALPQPAQAGKALDPAIAEAVAQRLRKVAADGRLAELRWPDFSDYRGHVQKIYEALNFAPGWSRDGQPTPQALAVIAALETSEQKGLNAEDYDASRWPARLDGLKNAGDNAAAIADFDAALTVSAMRYISDLHIGRVDPKYFKFGIDIESKKYDLPQFVLQKILTVADPQATLNEVEPPFDGYKRTQAALQRYLQMEIRDTAPPLPDVTKTLAPNDPYPGEALLVQRLQLLGDLPQNAIVDTTSGTYSSPVVEAVQQFQRRHGLDPSGKLGKETLSQLNTPLSARVLQLQDALERWRWVPPDFPQPPVVVNLPEFVLRAFSADRKVALRMNVVVGKSVRHQTPVFAHAIQYIVFRPYWNVPMSITRAEIIPGIQRDAGYLARKNFEVTDRNGRVVSSGAVSAEMIAQLRSGQLMVRQKPGPTNSLGLVKFIFPNQDSVYLHSTPAQQLFSQSRRDFSHGCVRVEKPVELAAWLLRNQPPWTLDRVAAAMQSGSNDQRVNLTIPVPVLIVYVTAVVELNGEVHFYDDIYGHDRALNAVLAKGQPYPR